MILFQGNKRKEEGIGRQSEGSSSEQDAILSLDDDEEWRRRILAAHTANAHTLLLPKVK